MNPPGATTYILFMWKNKLGPAIARLSQSKTQPSLFHYIREKPARKTAFSWKEFAGDIFPSFRTPLFIPSVFSNPKDLISDRIQSRTRKIEASMVSIFLHAAVLSAAFLMVYQTEKMRPQNEKVVFLNSPMTLPFFEGEGEGGGGGGGGKNEPGMWTTGRLPAAARVQLLPPDPQILSPISPAEDLFALLPSVQMPIDIPQDSSLQIGDIIAPPNNLLASGPGSGGGIGPGRGPGVGEGDGPGVGPGERGGMNGGRDGGVGNDRGLGIYTVGAAGVKPPMVLSKPRPAYTEEARKARIEGRLLLAAIIRKDGTVDGFRILRGLGYGLDDSAIRTIGSSWRFRPGTLNGVPVDVQANIEVDFRMY